MKLDTAIIDYLFNVVKVAKLVSVENIIIEPDMVRALNEGRTIVLHSTNNVPTLAFGSLGITRISELLSQYDILKNRDDLVIEAKPSDDGFAAQLILRTKGIKIEYNCADPRKINAPRNINDVMCYRVQLNQDVVTDLNKCSTARPTAESVSIISDGDKVRFELASINNEITEITLDEKVELVPNADGEVSSSSRFAHRYPVKTFLAMAKDSPDSAFSVGQKGIMSCPINDLTVYVLPQV